MNAAITRLRLLQRAERMEIQAVLLERAHESFGDAIAIGACYIADAWIK
jgi:hypothetical protein